VEREEVLWPIRHELVDLGDRKAKHHMVVFKKPIGYIVKTSTIRCSLFNWTLQHGGVKQWDWLDSGKCSLLAGDELGLLVPRTCWDWYWRFVSEREKLGSLRLEITPYEGPVPYFE
jgi:hypothetical protein